MDPQAKKLNETISNSSQTVSNLLSAKGKQAYFPKLGILSQSADAKGKDINATIGIALEDDGTPMALPGLSQMTNLDNKDIFPYAPSPGVPLLRESWKKMMVQKNPGLAGAPISLPVVTAALTHAISIVGYLFCDPDDAIILPDFYWENYDLTLTQAFNGKFKCFETFTKEGKFNLEGLKNQLSKSGKGKKIVCLNFPNNPTGYTLTVQEVDILTKILIEHADQGNQMAVFVDDAYFGLVFEEGIYAHSLFQDLCQAHPNLLAIKIDGATKEDYVWGFRIGFITYGIKGGSPELYHALEAKTSGTIRGSISNAPAISQAMLLKMYSSPDYDQQKREKFNTLKRRYDKIKEIFSAHPEYLELFPPLPFNSGYFMCVKPLKSNPEQIRQKLLKEYSTGLIALGDVIRVAYSSTPFDQLEILFDNLYQAIKRI